VEFINNRPFGNTNIGIPTKAVQDQMENGPGTALQDTSREVTDDDFQLARFYNIEYNGKI
jgi:hypothetical protein